MTQRALLAFNFTFPTKKESLRWKKVKDIRWKTVKRRRRRQGTNKPGLVLEVVPRVPECVKSQQHPVFQGGHPSKHWRFSSLLNLGDCLVTGPFNPIRPLTNVGGSIGTFEWNWLKFQWYGNENGNGYGLALTSETVKCPNGDGNKMGQNGQNWQTRLL